jgi:putative membrane protein
MMWGYDYWPGPFMFFGPIFFILMIAVCVGMMFFMMRGHRGGHGNSAAQILSDRFARGEIDKAEYEDRRRVLGA